MDDFAQRIIVMVSRFGEFETYNNGGKYVTEFWADDGSGYRQRSSVGSGNTKEEAILACAIEAIEERLK